MSIYKEKMRKNFTVMSNHHLQDATLSLKAKGLLSLMLSLPDDWGYNLKGLSRLCRDGVTGISSTVKELETAGYIVRSRARSPDGRIGKMEYSIREHPTKVAIPECGFPLQENPVPGKPVQEVPAQEKPTLLNTYLLNTKKQKTERQNTILSNPAKEQSGEEQMQARRRYRELLKENIEYDILISKRPTDKESIDGLLELMVDTICTQKELIHIAKNDFPAAAVKSRFLKLNNIHIEYVLDCLKKNTTEIRNIRSYLLTALYNAPATAESYYDTLAAHDLACKAEEKQKPFTGLTKSNGRLSQVLLNLSYRITNSQKRDM